MAALLTKSLLEKLRPDDPQPALTQAILSCPCPGELKAGMLLANGDWHLAHLETQALDSVLAAHWHALVHRHEPDFPNSKYWLRKVGQSPLYQALARHADELGQASLVTENGAWDPYAFTDCFADPAHHSWTRLLDRLETDLLMRHCLDAENK